MILVKTNLGVVSATPVGSKGFSLTVTYDGATYVIQEQMAVDRTEFWEWWKKFNPNEKFYDEDGDEVSPWKL